jgi:hypothetical protein
MFETLNTSVVHSVHFSNRNASIAGIIIVINKTIDNIWPLTPELRAHTVSILESIREERERKIWWLYLNIYIHETSFDLILIAYMDVQIMDTKTFS